MMLEKIYNRNKVYLAQVTLYTLGFLFLLQIIKFGIDKGELTWIYSADALAQHYPSQQYISNFFYDILHFKRSIFDELNYNVGLGQDILSTYHYYGLTDPLSVFTGLRKIYNHQKLYMFLMVLRMYLAGISFLIMSNGFGKDKNVSIIGSYVYIFSGYCLTIGFMHPYFINPMILLPLLISSIDALIREAKVIRFALLVCATIVINFYFAYMLLLIGFIYAIVSIVLNHKNGEIVESVKIFMRGLYGFSIGTLLSSFVLIPIVLGYMDSYRNSGFSAKNSFFVDGDFLKEFILNIFLTPNLKDAVFLGLSVLVFASIYSMFLNKEKKLITLFIIGALFIVSPKLQSVANGFSYPTYRWIFGFDLLISYIFVDQFDKVMKTTNRNRVGLLVLGFVYSAFVIVCGNENGKYKMLVLLLAIVIVCLGNYRSKKIAIMTISFIIISANVYTYSLGIEKSKALSKKEYVSQIDSNYLLRELGAKTNGTLMRLENGSNQYANFSDIFNYPSVSGYYSIENKYYSMFNLYYENSKASPLNAVTGFDSRVILDAVLSVKYHYGMDNIPYGFKEIRNGWLHENTNYLPFGFTYDKYLLREDIDHMNPIDKESFLMGACLLEENIDGVPRLVDTYKYLNNRKKLMVSPSSYTKNYKNEGLVVKTSLKIPKDGILYARFDSVDMFKENDRVMSTLAAKGIKGTKKLNTSFITKKTSKWYSGEENITINLGSVKKGDYDISYDIQKDGDFDLSRIKYYISDCTKLKEDIGRLSEDHLFNLKIDGDRISANINNEKAKLLFISLPYSRGYKVSINGIKTKVYRANVGFMAVALPEGNNTIVVDYSRPGQKIGYIISILALALILVVGFTRKKLKNFSMGRGMKMFR